MQGEDEVVFLDFRKELKVLIDNIAILVSMYGHCFCQGHTYFFGNGNGHGYYNLCKVLPGVSSETPHRKQKSVWTTLMEVRYGSKTK